jgi:hypothetical protein
VGVSIMVMSLLEAFILIMGLNRGASVGSIKAVVPVEDLIKTTHQEVRAILERVKAGL